MCLCCLQNLFPAAAASDSELVDESSKSSSWSPRVSVSANEDSDHLASGQTSPKRASAVAAAAGATAGAGNKFGRGKELLYGHKLIVL